jgi:hypothetical protein
MAGRRSGIPATQTVGPGDGGNTPAGISHLGQRKKGPSTQDSSFRLTSPHPTVEAGQTKNTIPNDEGSPLFAACAHLL